jgi:hypothetical protein
MKVWSAFASSAGVTYRLWNAKLQPSAYDSNAMAAISAGLHAPVVIWGQVDQFTPYHFDRFVPATPAYVEMTINAYCNTQASGMSGDARKQFMSSCLKIPPCRCGKARACCD